MPPPDRRRQPTPSADTIRIIVGCFVMALTFRLFLNPNGVVTGGVVGLSTLLERLTGAEAAWLQWGLNLPLLLVGLRFLGGGSGLRGVIGSLLLPLCILLLRPVPALTHNLLLAAIFGGLGYGLGLGLVFSGSGSVGGYSLAAQLLARVTPFGLSANLLALDALTIIGGAFLFGPEKALFGLISAFTMRRMVDAVLGGFNDAKLALIISERHDAIRRAVLDELDRGLTLLPGRGGYTDQDRPVLLVVLGLSEVARLRTLVRTHDPGAFMILTDTAEVLGQGFRSDR